MEPRLAKCARVDECDWNGHYIWSSTQRICGSKSFLYFGNKFSGFIQHLTITFIDEDFNPAIKAINAILQYCCGNLKTLTIYFRTPKLSIKDANHECTTPLLIRPKLTSVKIYDSTEHSDFLEMTQLIVNSAPKLTHFTYRGSKYPDFSRNKSIKWITVDMCCYVRATSVPSCSGVYGLNKMLAHVCDHLQFLHLKNNIALANPRNYGNDFPPNIEESRIDFQIPKIQNLKKFRNDMLDWFSCGDRLQNIATENMPNLRNLRIIKFNSNLDDILRNIGQKKDLFSGVKNLHVANVNDPESLIGLRTPFPNLESLTIQRFGRWHGSRLIEVGDHLQACAALGLKHLKLDISSQNTKLSEFINGFSNCEELWSCE